MPSLGVQELLVKQERVRIEQLARDAWQRNQLPSAPVSRWRRPLRQLALVLAVATTLMTSVVAASPTSGGDDADSVARNCVAHRSASCRETPFPINRMPVV